MKPVIALVGRPNVGKSTLFNRLTKTRDAIVADFAGLTRDRHYGNGQLGPHEYIVIDTGGFEPDATSGIYKEKAKPTRRASAADEWVIFVVDARAGSEPVETREAQQEQNHVIFVENFFDELKLKCRWGNSLKLPWLS